MLKETCPLGFDSLGGSKETTNLLIHKKIINMKKILNYLLMAATVCGISLAAASCSSNDDNPATPDLGVKEKIIGKWMEADVNGEPLLTNRKIVFNFVSATKALVSASRNSYPESGFWVDHEEADVTIDGNKVTLTIQSDEHTTSVMEFNVTAISSSEFTANRKLTVTIDGNVVHTANEVFRLVKQTADYREEVLGLWECTGLTGIETYNDANARLVHWKGQIRN